ncbi:calcium-binding and coiled-coil domain-containing protein 1 [Pyxicephalus adspersus]|uniref:calcium-binding and coiled-coil domain-containing protein 1 n=1 Tax=Pyxicephalus adspersus TaxID=30357 RepID=UPI003B5BD4EE
MEASSHPVRFLNVAHTYVPRANVECHYTLPAGMKGSNRDWIGIFKVSSSSVHDYETFVWAASSESSGDESVTRCSVQFQAYYLPRPGEQQYQFHYVDQHGTVKGISEPFAISEPRPMEDLVTLEDEEASLDMILVVPKSDFLQQQLESSQQERNDLMRVRLTLEEVVSSLNKKVQRLEAALEASDNKHSKLDQQYQKLFEREQTAIKELDALSKNEAEQKERILQLERDIQIMDLKLLEKEKETDTLKTIKESLEVDKEELKQRLAEAASENGRSKLQIDILREKLRRTQDMLSSNQQKVKLLIEELASTASLRDRTISDLHKSRLESADLALKVSDLSFRYKEGMGQWWQEKTALNQSIEAKREQIVIMKAEKLTLESNLQEERNQRQNLQCKLNQEKDACQVQLSESRRELSELKSALKVAQMEKEQLREENQELMQYMKRLEERLDNFADEKWREDKLDREESNPGLVSLPESDEESSENSKFPMHEDPFTVISSIVPMFLPESAKVVINQPAPIACQLQPLPEDNSDSW